MRKFNPLRILKSFITIKHQPEIISADDETPRARTKDALPPGRARSCGHDQTHPLRGIRSAAQVITTDNDSPAEPAPGRARMADVVRGKDAVDFDAIPQPIPLPNGPAAQREYLQRTNPPPTTPEEKHVVATREFGYRQTAPDPKEAETRLKKGIAHAAMDARAIDQRNADIDAVYASMHGKDARSEKLATGNIHFVDAIPYDSLVTSAARK